MATEPDSGPGADWTDPDRAAPLEEGDFRFNRDETAAIHQLVAAAANLADSPRTWSEIAADLYLGERARLTYSELTQSGPGVWWTYQGRYFILVPRTDGGTDLISLTPPQLRKGSKEPLPETLNKNPDATGPSEPQGAD